MRNVDLKYLKNKLNTYEFQMLTTSYPPIFSSDEISALSDAIDKQITKAPKLIKAHPYVFEMCPECGSTFTGIPQYNVEFNYCANCGKKIKR